MKMIILKRTKINYKVLKHDSAIAISYFNSVTKHLINQVNIDQSSSLYIDCYDDEEWVGESYPGYVGDDEEDSE